MNNALGSLKPEHIWKHFEAITEVPRPSKKEEKIVAFMEEWAKKEKLEYKKDELGNLAIKVPATPGWENKETVVIQGHLDMVCEKNRGVEFDFDNDPIKVKIDGDWVKAEGTTLGADNGIGVAAGMALATDPDAKHGPLELLCTLDEETGLTGASSLEEGMVDGRLMLNLDSEEDGVLYIGCSGGIDAKGFFEYIKESVPANSAAVEIKILGLQGGHSGLEIERGFGNAIKMLGRVLVTLDNKYEMNLATIEGGSKRNAIPREAFAVITVPNEKVEDVIKDVAELEATLQAEIKTVEPKLTIEAVKTEAPEFVIDAKTKSNLILTIFAMHHGVLKMSADIEGLVETSTNLATVVMNEKEIEVGTSQRSSVGSENKEASEMVMAIFKLAGAKTWQGDGYPGWKPNVESPLLDIVKSSYKELFKAEPEVKAIHAGLECGIINMKYPDMDMISFGPTIMGAHSPDERLEIKTVQKFWDLVLQVLKNVPEKK